MDENILAGLALDESKTFARIKPLYCSVFSQLFSLFFSLSYLVLLLTTSRAKKTKGRKCELAAPYIAKGFTRATNAVPSFHILAVTSI